ncbi:hypothetical protein GETHPA_30300 [Geothrix rubra]|uniref:SdpI family protein n=1 Tax=Geothrix rubra TaxID=2927977 RepID=A0ABQ5QAM0_9BACT|nr:SdpI family protein [Geothrix rubra]GLH71496.1 hypothetical protein GETHPA_30300 [Geothrix rubra]
MNQWIIFIAINALFAALCIPLIRREVPINSIYGFRFPVAMKSEEAWYRVNSFGGKVLAITSCLSIAGLVTLRIAGQNDTHLYLSVFVFPIVFTSVATLVYANRQA